MTLHRSLSQFADENRFTARGQICVALHITRCAIERGLPLDSESFVPNGDGRVAGLSKARVQSILASHGESRLLSSAGGRTNRGNTPSVRGYCHFLNDSPFVQETNLGEIEEWWVDRVRVFFEAKPLRLNLEPGRTVESIISDLLKQARTRQRDQKGATLAGTVLQHLIGAKLEIVLGNKAPALAHHGASVADAPTARTGDFIINRTSIHVTLTPGDDVIAKCTANIGAGLHPILIVPFLRAQAVMQRAEELGVGAKLEIIPAEQFLASNIHEWAGFNSSRTETSLAELVDMYNQIISVAETDQSLIIE